MSQNNRYREAFFEEVFGKITSKRRMACIKRRQAAAQKWRSADCECISERQKHPAQDAVRGMRLLKTTSLFVTTADLKDR